MEIIIKSFENWICSAKQKYPDKSAKELFELYTELRKTLGYGVLAYYELGGKFTDGMPDLKDLIEPEVINTDKEIAKMMFDKGCTPSVFLLEDDRMKVMESWLAVYCLAEELGVDPKEIEPEKAAEYYLHKKIL